MPGIGLGISPIFGGYVTPYLDKILAIESANLIALWPQSELSGATADNAEGTAARDGTYTGVTLNNASGPDGSPTPLFDGINDFNNIFGTDPNNLDDVFDFDEGTAAIWMKVFDVGVWADGLRGTLIRVYDSSSNFFWIYKNTTANQIRFQYKVGASALFGTTVTTTSTAWLHFALTWSLSAGELNQYFNGTVTVDSPFAISTPETSTHPFNAGRLLVGAEVTTPVGLFYGWLAYPTIWTKALTAAQILKVATP